jgi:hypothetical protein
VSGQARDGTPLVFAAYVSGEICEGFGLCGMHRYHEYLLDASNNALTIRDQLTYRFDLMDGDDEEAMTMLNATGLTIVLLILYLLIAVLRHFIRFIQRYIIQPPVPHRA